MDQLRTGGKLLNMKFLYLIVRVAGYSDYLSDLSRELQDEIIARTVQQGEMA